MYMSETDILLQDSKEQVENQNIRDSHQKANLGEFQRAETRASDLCRFQNDNIACSSEQTESSCQGARAGQGNPGFDIATCEPSALHHSNVDSDEWHVAEHLAEDQTGENYDTERDDYLGCIESWQVEQQGLKSVRVPEALNHDEERHEENYDTPVYRRENLPPPTAQQVDDRRTKKRHGPKVEISLHPKQPRNPHREEADNDDAASPR